MSQLQKHKECVDTTGIKMPLACTSSTAQYLMSYISTNPYSKKMFFNVSYHSEKTTAKVLTHEWFVGSEALMLVILTFIIFWNMMQCSLVDGYQTPEKHASSV